MTILIGAGLISFGAMFGLVLCGLLSANKIAEVRKIEFEAGRTEGIKESLMLAQKRRNVGRWNDA